MNKSYAVILAAGKGKRMKADVNKQFLNIKDKPLLYYSLNTFSQNNLIDGIVLVCAEDEIDYCKKQIVDKYQIKKVIDIVSGGNERQDSVYNGLKALKDCNVVLIHDGARPFVSDKIIESGIRYAEKFGACACGTKPKDTIKVRLENNISKCTLDRDSLVAVQTPQCFKYDLILTCHERLASDKLSVTDDTAVVEKYGHDVYLFEGSYDNIKITTPEDIIIAEKILKKFIM